MGVLLKRTVVMVILAHQEWDHIIGLGRWHKSHDADHTKGTNDSYKER